jgi:hypothetical protein
MQFNLGVCPEELKQQDPNAEIFCVDCPQPRPTVVAPAFEAGHDRAGACSGVVEGGGSVQ